MGEEKEKTFRELFQGHATAIGFFFNNWGVTENILIRLLADLLATDQLRAKIVFTEFSALGIKFKLMRRILYTHYPDDDARKKFLALLGDTQKLSDRRNLYAHAAWGMQPESQKIMLLPGTAPDDYKAAFKPPEEVTAEEIEEDVAKVSALNKRWQRFFLDVLPTMKENPQVSTTRDVLDRMARSDPLPKK